LNHRLHHRSGSITVTVEEEEKEDKDEDEETRDLSQRRRISLCCGRITALHSKSLFKIRSTSSAMRNLSTMSTRHAVCSSRAVRHQQACILEICSAGRIIFHFPFQPLAALVPSLPCAVDMCVVSGCVGISHHVASGLQHAIGFLHV
jgi:hypothetical protein